MSLFILLHINCTSHIMLHVRIYTHSWRKEEVKVIFTTSITVHIPVAETIVTFIRFTTSFYCSSFSCLSHSHSFKLSIIAKPISSSADSAIDSPNPIWSRYLLQISYGELMSYESPIVMDNTIYHLQTWFRV